VSKSGSGSSSKDPSRSLENPALASIQAGIEEVLNWLVGRLAQRAIETRREKDLDERGQRNVIDWLNADKYVFEQKFHTLAAICPIVDDVHAFVAVGDQLTRLRYRCSVIITNGFDPIGGQEFTFEVPRAVGESASPIVDHAIEVRCLLFKESLHYRRSPNPSMQERFEMAARAIDGVSDWINRREFDAS